MGKEHLTPFKKGDPRASAAGKKSKRPPSIATAIKKLLSEDKNLTPELLAKACIKHALNGSAQHMRLMVEYIDGKVKDEIEVTQTINEINVNFIEPKKIGNKRPKKT